MGLEEWRRSSDWWRGGCELGWGLALRRGGFDHARRKRWAARAVPWFEEVKAHKSPVIYEGVHDFCNGTLAGRSPATRKSAGNFHFRLVDGIHNVWNRWIQEVQPNRIWARSFIVLWILCHDSMNTRAHNLLRGSFEAKITGARSATYNLH